MKQNISRKKSQSKIPGNTHKPSDTYLCTYRKPIKTKSETIIYMQKTCKVKKIHTALSKKNPPKCH